MHQLMDLFSVPEMTLLANINEVIIIVVIISLLIFIHMIYYFFYLYCYFIVFICLNDY